MENLKYREKKLSNIVSSITFEDVFEAYELSKKKKKSKNSVLRFEENLIENLTVLHKEIISGTYKPEKYIHFVVYEPKKRDIYAPTFRDLIVQHLFYKILNDKFDRSLISTCFACRKGKGTHACSDWTQKHMRRYSSNKYILKLDIRKFFYRIDRKILLNLYKKKIKDETLLKYLSYFFEMDSDVGIPIGNLLSQISANIYLNEIDQYVKRVLKVKSYARYMDDMILIGLTLEQAKMYKENIEEQVKNKLNMEFSKFSYQKIKKGTNFVGYRTWKSKRFIRKHSLYKFKNALKKNKIEIMLSILAHSKNTTSYVYLINNINSIKRKELKWLQKSLNITHTKKLKLNILY